MKVCSNCGERNEDWMDICQRCGNSIMNANQDGSVSTHTGYDNYGYNDGYNNDGYDYNNNNYNNYGYDNNNDDSGSHKPVENIDLKIILAVLLVILIILIIYTISTL